MWLDYFPQASVAGFDIDDFSGVRLPRARIFRGDQGNASDLIQVGRECGMFDVIIDDGSHASFHQQLTIETLFPFLKPGGLFVIEDLAWQPADLERALPRVPKTTDWLRDRQALDRRIAGIRDVLFFTSPLNRSKEGLAVIVKA